MFFFWIFLGKNNYFLKKIQASHTTSPVISCKKTNGPNWQKQQNTTHGKKKYCALSSCIVRLQRTKLRDPTTKHKPRHVRCILPTPTPIASLRQQQVSEQRKINTQQQNEGCGGKMQGLR